MGKKSKEAAEEKKEEEPAKSTLEGWEPKPRGLRAEARKYLTEELTRAIKMVNEDKDKGAASELPVVLVVDSFAAGMISSVFTATDILDLGFVVVEKLSASRHPYPTFNAVYFVRPTKKNIKRIIQDYNVEQPEATVDEVGAPTCSDKFFACVLPKLELPLPPPKYNDCVIMAVAGTETTSAAMVKHRISLSDNINDRFTSHFKDTLNIAAEYQVPEPHLFLLDEPAAARLHVDDGIDKIVKKISHRLASLCYSINEFPIIRTRNTPKSDISRAVAESVGKRLSQLAQVWRNKTKPTSRATLLIVDRAEDVLTPLMHSFGYQACAMELNDMAPMQPYKDKRTGLEVLLDDNDPVWVHARHMHFANAADFVAAEYNIVRQHQEDLKSKHKGASTTDDMAKLVASLVTADNVLPAKLKLHYKLLKSVANLLETNCYQDLTVYEEQLATGKKDSGSTAKHKSTVQDFVEHENDFQFADCERLRALCYATCNPRKRKTVANVVDQNVAEALQTLPFDFDFVKSISAAADAVRPAPVADESELVGGRYKCLLANLAELALANALPDDEEEGYPQVEDEAPPFFQVEAAAAPSDGGRPTAVGGRTAAGMEEQGETKVASDARSRRTGPKRAFKVAQDSTTDIGITPSFTGGAGAGAGAGTGLAPSASNKPDAQTLIICVIGGISYAEARALEDVMARHEGRPRIFYGGTHVVTGAMFMTELNELNTDLADLEDVDVGV